LKMFREFPVLFESFITLASILDDDDDEDDDEYKSKKRASQLIAYFYQYLIKLHKILKLLIRTLSLGIYKGALCTPCVWPWPRNN